MMILQCSYARHRFARRAASFGRPSRLSASDCGCTHAAPRTMHKRWRCCGLGRRCRCPWRYCNRVNASLGIPLMMKSGTGTMMYVLLHQFLPGYDTQRPSVNSRATPFEHTVPLPNKTSLQDHAPPFRSKVCTFRRKKKKKI
jgi:hypothetical protein